MAVKPLEIKDTFDYYDFSKVMSYNAVYNYIVGGRGIGKTYGAIKDAISAGIKRGEQFIYLRRYKEELAISRNTFFNEVSQEFPDYEFRVHGMNGQVKHKSAGNKSWKTICYFIALSVAQKVKSVSFHKVKKIIYDEFIIEKGRTQYLPNEAITFNNFYMTVDRYRDEVKVLFLANSVSIMNPYFIAYEIEPQKEFEKYYNGFIVCHFVDSEDFNNKAFKTRFGKFVAKTEYADYAIRNKFADNDDRLLGRKESSAMYMYSLITARGKFSVWYDPRNLEFHCQQRQPKEPLWHTTEPHLVNENIALMLRRDRMLESLRTAFRQGRVYFDKPVTRNAMTEVFIK